MTAFTVNDMTCGHCASTITKAVQAVDAQAKVEIDLGRHLVRVDSGVAGDEAIRQAIAEAGYTPEPVAA